MRLEDELLEFLWQPLMCIIAAVDCEGRPAPGRGIGVQVTDDRESIDVIFSGWQWPRIEAGIRKTGRLAATFVRPSDYVTYQIKGPAAMRDTKVQDLEDAERFMANATGELTSLGVPPSIILPWLTARDAKVARLTAMGLSGISCAARHNGQQGAPVCHDAKNLRYRTTFSTNCWPALTPQQRSAMAAYSIH